MRTLLLLLLRIISLFFVFQQKGLEPKESDKFRSGLMATNSEYAEEILSPHFGDLIQFVKEAERELQAENVKGVLSEEGNDQTGQGYHRHCF